MDTRCRYKYTIIIDDISVWSGYLLHEEAWFLLNNLAGTKKAIIFDEDQISNKSDQFILK